MKVQAIKQLPPDIQVLVSESQPEGYRFLKRLVDDYRNETNLFDQHGEVLISVRDDNTLVAIGGINNHDGVARLRRFYVSKAHRRSGVGRLLLEALESHAALFFSEVLLFTDTTEASRFYEACGYIAVSENKVSHRKVFTKDNKALGSRIHKTVIAINGSIDLDLPPRSMPRSCTNLLKMD
ncbi:N-acetyltransferase [Leucothrix sargassi]|nr:N-acetyltransferase [Leucothrix sargassi]